MSGKHIQRPQSGLYIRFLFGLFEARADGHFAIKATICMFGLMTLGRFYGLW